MLTALYDHSQANLDAKTVPKKGQIDFFNSQNSFNDGTLQNDSILSGNQNARFHESHGKQSNSLSTGLAPKRSSSASYLFKNGKSNQLEPIVSDLNEIKLEDH